MPRRRKHGYYRLIGNRLQRLRESRSLHQDEVAKELKLSQSSVSRYETAGRVLDVYELVDICAYYGISQDQLMLPPMGEWEEMLFNEGGINWDPDVYVPPPGPDEDPWLKRIGEKQAKKR